MKRYEYFQETSEDIASDSWKMLLDKHGSQGWELSSVIPQAIYKLNLGESVEVARQEEKVTMQTLYFVVFKREY